ncbi:MAG: sialidase family protein [Pirellulales bacterium]
MERFVAIDNVCAWPNLTRLPDGAIAANIYNQLIHGDWEGDVECWASEDEGRTWALRGTPAPHEPTTNRMNIAAGLAQDGTLIVLASGWSPRLPVGQYSRPPEAQVLPTWASRSKDGGRTWDVHKEAVLPKRLLIPFGDIVQLTDGALGASVYDPAEEGNSSHFCVSKDGGRTWSLRGTVRDGDANETALVVLPKGRLLAAVRTDYNRDMALHVSDDAGATWTHRSSPAPANQHPGHLLVLQDGRDGIRNQGLFGVGTRLSEDGGETWLSPQLLVSFDCPNDSGYPSSVQAADGTIVTAYYVRSVPAHQRYHMGVVRWQLEE